MTRDEWRYIIPRPYLDALAGCMGLGRNTQVLIALLCRLYGVTENSGSETPEAPVTVSSLVKLTGRDRRSVERSLAILYHSGIVFNVDTTPGRATVRGLNPRLKQPPVESAGGTTVTKRRGLPRVPGVRSKSDGGVPAKSDGGPPAKSDHTHKEQVLKNTLEELPRRTLDFAEAEAAPSLNGHVKHIEKGNDRRQERKATVHEIADVLRKRGEGMTSGEIAQALQANPVSVASALGHNDAVFSRSGYDRQRDQNIYGLREWGRR